jgi:hypothetical protein
MILYGHFVSCWPDHFLLLSDSNPTYCFSLLQLILGGSYTGQLVLWDATSPSFKPIQTISNASMSTGAVSPHQHPIYSIRPIDSRYFVTTDTMGTLAVWDINELRKPVELLELTWVKRFNPFFFLVRFVAQHADTFLLFIPAPLDLLVLVMSRETLRLRARPWPVPLPDPQLTTRLPSPALPSRTITRFMLLLKMDNYTKGSAMEYVHPETALTNEVPTCSTV